MQLAHYIDAWINNDESINVTPMQMAQYIDAWNNNDESINVTLMQVAQYIDAWINNDLFTGIGQFLLKTGTKTRRPP